MNNRLAELRFAVGYTMPATDTEIREVEKMFAVNVLGPMRMVRYFHRLLVATKGTIVNVGSIGGIVPYIYGGTAFASFSVLIGNLTGSLASYNATKAALHHYGNTLRAELKPFGCVTMGMFYSGNLTLSQGPGREHHFRRDWHQHSPQRCQ